MSRRAATSPQTMHTLGIRRAMNAAQRELEAIPSPAAPRSKRMIPKSAAVALFAFFGSFVASANLHPCEGCAIDPPAVVVSAPAALDEGDCVLDYEDAAGRRTCLERYDGGAR